MWVWMAASSVFAGINVIPKPNKITELNGRLALSSKIELTGTLAGSPHIKTCVDSLSLIASDSSTPLRIHIDSYPQGAEEGYQLCVGKDGVQIKATTSAGGFYALQTLKQLMLFSEDGTIPFIKIKDAPRYSWRGFMLDESRHFFGKKKVKQLLDTMAMYKLNRFHWHLTDSDGWRIEIKKYPKLTSIGAIGNHTDKKAPSAFYTQEEIKEIVTYAAQRFITIIPEIDMPGHAAAAVRAYPEIGGGGSSKHPDFTFNPASEKTYTFLTDVFTELSGLFPGKWLHFGGDEVHFANKKWIELPEVKKLMATEKLEDLKGVEHYFNRRMAGVITSLNRTTVAWDEITEAGLDTDKTLVMWWRHNKKETLESAFNKNYRVVLCPRVPCYFDFVQDKSHTVGRRWGGKFGNLTKVYAFPAGLDLVESQVAGIQANLWTETVVTEKRFDYMIYPRLLALGEASWTDATNKNFNHFEARLKDHHIPAMKENGVYYFNPFDKEEHPEPKR